MKLQRVRRLREAGDRVSDDEDGPASVDERLLEGGREGPFAERYIGMRDYRQSVVGGSCKYPMVVEIYNSNSNNKIYKPFVSI